MKNASIAIKPITIKKNKFLKKDFSNWIPKSEILSFSDFKLARIVSDLADLASKAVIALFWELRKFALAKTLFFETFRESSIFDCNLSKEVFLMTL